MDYRSFPQSPQKIPYDKRSRMMSVTALCLGILSVVTCLYATVSIPCGALAILLALLSRGGSYSCDARSWTGLGLGIGGLVMTFLLYFMTISILIVSYGGIKSYVNEMKQYDFSDERHFAETYEQWTQDSLEHLNDLLGRYQAPALSPSGNTQDPGAE